MKLHRIGRVLIAAAVLISALLYGGTATASAADASKPVAGQPAKATDPNAIPIFGSLLNEEPATDAPRRVRPTRRSAAQPWRPSRESTSDGV